MSRFSEYLERIILRSGMKEKELSKASGFARSYIALMKTGQRVSPDVEKMTKLMYALNLPPYELEEFKEEYYRARIGDEAYERDQSVIDFIHSFDNASKLCIKEYHTYDIPEVHTVNNRMDLERLIKAVIKNEAEKEEGYVRILMQGTGTFLKNILSDVCESNKELPIDHIVCMEQSCENGSKDDNLYNIKLLKELIPIAVFSNSKNYNLYYYYDHVASKYNTGSLLNYMVLTSEYLICMDSSMTMGMVNKDGEIRALYESIFQKNKRNCRQMLYYINDEKDMFRNHVEQREDVTYSIAQQPNFSVLKIHGLLKKYVNHYNNQDFLKIEQMIQKNCARINEDDYKYVSYCSKEGLEKFALEGLITGLPEKMRVVLDKRERKFILNLLLEMIETGKYELYFLEENIPKEVFINVYSSSNLEILYLSEKLKMRFVMNESSTGRIIHDSLKSMFKNPKVGSLEDTKKYIEKIILDI